MSAPVGPAAPARVPVSLVTGFLGSGKTTLIAALLRQPAMHGTAVIVNEFGAVGIDDAIFAEALDEDDVALLTNGCLCCAAGDDLARTVFSLVRRAPVAPRRMVIETSGLADPAAALRRLMADPRLRGAIRLDALVATIDAVDGMQNLASQPVAARQCAVADRRVITKRDLAGPAAAEALKHRLAALNPTAAVIVADHGAVEADRLFGAALVDPRTGRADADRWLGRDRFGDQPDRDAGAHGGDSVRFSGDHAHDHAIGTWLVEERRAIDWDRLKPMLGDIVARHGDRLLRLKGIIHTRGDDRPLVIHGVQRVFHAPVRLGGWTRPPATSIVAIGDEGAAPAIELIGAALDRCAVGRPLAVPA